MINECNNDFYKVNIKQLEDKLKEKELLIINHLHTIDGLREEIQTLKSNNLTKQNGIDSCDREKLMDIASCIFNNYATSNDVNNLIVRQDTDTNLKEVSLNIIFGKKF
jgi:hypothetical protein